MIHTEIQGGQVPEQERKGKEIVLEIEQLTEGLLTDLK